MRLTLPKTEPGKPWTLRVVPRPPRLDGEECWGTCNWAKREIVIWKGASKHGMSRDTIIHELTHKCFPWMKEEVVDAFATSVDEVLDLAESRGILEL